MSERSDKVFDRLMQEKFRDFKAEPSPLLWDKIKTELDKPAKKHFPYAWIAAAAVLIFAAFGLWLNYSSPLQLTEELRQAELQQTEAGPHLNQATEQETLVKGTAATVPVSKPQKIKSASVKYAQVPAGVPVQADRPAAESVKSYPSPETVLTSEPLLAANQTGTVSPNEVNSLGETAVPVEEEPLHRQRGGIGRLVNKLVAKVDSREDKLIEVSEDAGEGLKITGLNLGLLKLKTVNTNK